MNTFHTNEAVRLLRELVVAVRIYMNDDPTETDHFNLIMARESAADFLKALDAKEASK